ncbi:MULTISPECIES: diguanylate cyclase [unclassified Pseudodesulfovibrio]|uniref:diguanylate cyclase n=1 Tax=unclassified Pseudodesulfovibrio TaxID=2661612 RepID=UPI000FEBAA6D|nr:MULTISPECIES: diguanylate cyclase [unclassified Pseudodesulfovibrio]MCJ2164810.1 diguanylate cyclase [Pseudodesulfovibrio sp. S3-i]RWU03818.1 diguanylate cyclase [Pseudodesulfovibrio sp. S3]
MGKTSLRKQLDEAQKRIRELESELAPDSDAACPILYDLIFENAPGGMTIISRQGEILACNREAGQILGYDSTELIGRSTEDFYANLTDRIDWDALLQQEDISAYQIPLRRKDWKVVWINFNARATDYGSEKAVLISFTDITAHREALKRVELDEIRFEKLYALSEMTRKSEAEILSFTLEAITEVTGGRIGYIFRVNEDETELALYAWSMKVMKQCTMEPLSEKYKVSETGLWGDAIRQRRPVIHNDYQGIPNKRGYPEGHVPIVNHMNVPVLDEDRIVLLAGVGNKSEDFSQTDVRQMQLIMNGAWRVIQRKRARAELKAAHEELEAKVSRRTARLEEANKELALLNIQLVKKDRERELTQNALIRYERIIETNPDLISLIDKNYRYCMVNDAYALALGKKQEDIVGKTMVDILGHNRFEAASRPHINKAFNGEIVRVESWFDLPKTGKLYMAITYHPVSIDGINIDYVSIDSRNMTDLKKNEEALKEIADRLDMATDAGNIGIWEWDLLTDELFWDHKMLELYKVEQDAFSGMFESWRSLVHPEDLAGTEQKIMQCIELKNPLQMEFRIVWPDGSIRTIRVDAQVQVDENATPLRVIGVSMDITEQRTMENELRRLASTDPLTGASNRRQFMERLTEEFDRCKRYNTSLVLLSLDIDHFKNINDNFGHPSGDDVLKELVVLSKTTLRTTDLFGRVGGEEFLAALTQTSITAGVNTAERLRKLIEESPVETHGHAISYTISIGVTEIHPDDNSIEDILKRADEALYEAKHKGRNRVVVL